MYAVELYNILKKYGSVIAVNNVTHKVRRGEVHVLLGPNGSGKTTLLKITCGIIRPNRGKVLINGRNPFEDSEVKKEIGYAPQEPLLYEDLSGYENALLYARINDLPKGEAKKRIKALAKALGIGEWFFKRRLKTYSGGMMKKASILTALVHDPEVIILDEPTSGLDPNSRRELWNFIMKLKSLGKTILIASHLFDDAEVLADNVVIMYKGSKVLEGNPEELKRKFPCRYSIEIEFVNKPSKGLVETLKDLSYDRKMLVYGLTYRIYVNDVNKLSDVNEVIQYYGVKTLRLEVKSLSLDDVYFMVTGVMLGGE